ncbi:MAG: hypothetical protein IT372_08290 [Polyangiaceae bacterium]|nr:hypothetical protein [Polyangiaceae bacterium]
MAGKRTSVPFPRVMTTRWPTPVDLRAEAVASGLLVDVSETAAEQGFDMRLYASAAVMQAHGVAGLRAIAIVISTMPELCAGPQPIKVAMHDGGPALNVAREHDGAIVVTVADA